MSLNKTTAAAVLFLIVALSISASATITTPPNVIAMQSSVGVGSSGYSYPVTFSAANGTKLSSCVDSAVLSVTPGLSKPSSPATDQWSAVGWTAANQYFEFTITLKPGRSFIANAFFIGGIMRSSSGPSYMSIAVSKDGGTNWTYKITSYYMTASTYYNFPLDISDLGVVSGTFKMRVYAWGATNALGTFRIGDYSPALGQGTSFGVTGTSYGGGSGTSGDPYKIASVDDLLALSAITGDYNKYFILTADIDLTGQTFATAVIAPDTDSSTGAFQGTAFTGVFDGAGYKITHLGINTGGADNDFLGLFGRIDSGAQVNNLGVEAVGITGGGLSDEVGGLAGENNGIIRNCHSTGSVANGSSNSSQAGGLVGANLGTITNSFSNCTVTGHSTIGGLVGAAYDGTIGNCFATGTVNGTGDDIGGLMGDNYGSIIGNCYSTGAVTGATGSGCGGLVGNNVYGTISNCYSAGAVSGNYVIGGLAGSNYSIISNCCSAGAVTGTTSVGGFVGDNSGTFTACFWNTDTNPGLPGVRVGPAGGVTGATTAQMQTRSTFTSVGWDFTNEKTNGTNNYWRMCVDGVNYPQLEWEFNADGDFTCPDGVRFEDFAVLANAWMSTSGGAGWNGACDISMPADGKIDNLDLATITDNWLAGK